MRTAPPIAPNYRTRPDPKRRNRPLEEAPAPPASRLEALRLTRKLALPGKAWMYSLLGVLALAAMGIGGQAYFEQMPVREVKPVLIAGSDNAFLNEADIQEMLTAAFGGELVGAQVSGATLALLEDTLNQFPSIQQAEVYKTFTGELVAEVEFRTPMARLVNNSGYNIYIDPEGRKFPPSRRHAARVMLVRGNFDENLFPTDTFSCSSIPEAFPLMRYIVKDSFWNNQISEIEIAQTGEVNLYPQVGFTVIEFGYPERIEEKFRNLRLFYEQGANVLGWDAYQKVSLKYRSQVVATRRKR